MNVGKHTSEMYMLEKLLSAAVAILALATARFLFAEQTFGHDVKVLCDALADEAAVDFQAPDGLVAAAAMGDAKAVCALLASDSWRLRSVDGDVALRAATVENHVLVLQVLLAAGASTRVADGDGYTALHVAAFAAAWRSTGDSTLGVMRTLLEYGRTYHGSSAARGWPRHITLF